MPDPGPWTLDPGPVRAPSGARTIFLDAGGVLVHPNWHRVADALAAAGHPADPAALTRAQLIAGHQLDTPDLVRQTNDDQRWSIYIGTIFQHAGLRLDAPTLQAVLTTLRDYHATHNLWERVPDDIPPALDRLRAAGFRLVVVSNANGTVRAKLDRLGLGSRFDRVFDSHEEGVEKPDPRFFRIALERTGATPETTIHVGDLYHIDVVGARAAGLRAVLFDPGGLYTDADVPRVASLGALVDALEAGRI